jgi:hypothetical protein
MTIQTDFYAVAKAAKERGFSWITPVKDKKGRLRYWNKYNPAKTSTELRMLAQEFQGNDVGIVSKRGVGNIFIVDIDKEGVIERLEAETGRKLPDTYQTRTRPETAPWKRHVYFFQTPYSVSRFTKEMNGLQDYDVKGTGAGGLVVAEGCVRDTGEVIAGNGSPVLDVPDWLVDWLYEDSKKLRERVREERKAKQTELKQILADKENQASVQTAVVPKGQRTYFLKSRAGSFIRLAPRSAGEPTRETPDGTPFDPLSDPLFRDPDRLGILAILDVTE